VARTHVSREREIREGIISARNKKLTKTNPHKMANTGMGKMHLDLYTQNAGLTHKAKFWCNYVSALKGAQDLRAPEDRIIHPVHPSIVETLPDTFPELKHEFSKLESQMFDKPKRPGLAPLTPVLPDANDRIFSVGYSYYPVHTEIYGTYRPNRRL